MTKPVIESLRIGPEKNFCYLVLCPETGEAALIDPAFEYDRVVAWVKSFGRAKTVSVKYLIATHGHWDHAGGMPEMLNRLPGAKVVAHEAEAGRLEKAHIPLHVALKDGGELPLGRLVLKAIHTPGHTEGGCCYQVDNEIFTGDTLFVGQCGRTDMQGGSNEKLFASLQRLKNLPPELIVRPGHDYGPTPISTIGHEAATNPTMMAQTLREFEELP